MANTSERSAMRAADKTSPGATGKSSGNNTQSPANPANTASAAPSGTSSASSTMGSALGEWRDRLSVGVNRLLAPRPAPGTQPAAAGKGQSATGATGAATAPQRPRTGRAMLGMLAFVAGAELLLFLVQMADLRLFHGYLELHTVASRDTPLLGGLSWFLLILMVLTLGLWLALNRLGIIKPLSQRPQTSAARGTAAQPTTAVGRNRAARQRATEASGTTTAKASTAKTSTSTSTRRAVTGTGSHDAAYQRVKAAQRSRKRRDAKR